VETVATGLDPADEWRSADDECCRMLSTAHESSEYTRRLEVTLEQPPPMPGAVRKLATPSTPDAGLLVGFSSWFL